MKFIKAVLRPERVCSTSDVDYCISRLGRVTLKMYPDTVTNYFKKVFSNVIQVTEYESNVNDWITSRTD